MIIMVAHDPHIVVDIFGSISWVKSSPVGDRDDEELYIV